MNILIAGGTGYLGSRLAEFCASQGSNVIILTRKTLDSFSGHKIIEYKQVDWQNFDKYSKDFQNIDTVINAAGATSTEYRNNFTNSLEINRQITKNLIEVSNIAKVKHFLQFSSIHVYGNNLKGEVTEVTKTDDTEGYARGHIECEKIISLSEITKGTVLRLSNVFGPPSLNHGDCWNLVVNSMCKEAVINKTITLRSTGEQYRNFLPISEMITRVEALAKVISPENLPNTINIGGNKTISILELVEKIRVRCEVVLGFNPKIISSREKLASKTPRFTLSTIRNESLPNFEHVEVEKELDANLTYIYENY